MDFSIILPILKKIPLFADLSEVEHKEVIENMAIRRYPAESFFFRQGDHDPEDGFYVITEGKVKIFKGNGDGQEEVLATLGTSDFFGEMALLAEEARNASAVALTDCEVCKINKSDFMALMQSNPTLAGKISEEYVRRENKNNKPKML